MLNYRTCGLFLENVVKLIYNSFHDPSLFGLERFQTQIANQARLPCPEKCVIHVIVYYNKIAGLGNWGKVESPRKRKRMDGQ